MCGIAPHIQSIPTLFTCLWSLICRFNVYVFLRSNTVWSHTPVCLRKCTAVFHNQNKCGTLTHLTLASTVTWCALGHCERNVSVLISSIWICHVLCFIQTTSWVWINRAMQHCTTRWGSSMDVWVGHCSEVWFSIPARGYSIACFSPRSQGLLSLLVLKALVPTRAVPLHLNQQVSDQDRWFQTDSPLKLRSQYQRMSNMKRTGTLLWLAVLSWLR